MEILIWHTVQHSPRIWEEWVCLMFMSDFWFLVYCFCPQQYSYKPKCAQVKTLFFAVLRQRTGCKWEIKIEKFCLPKIITVLKSSLVKQHARKNKDVWLVYGCCRAKLFFFWNSWVKMWRTMFWFFCGGFYFVNRCKTLQFRLACSD